MLELYTLSCHYLEWQTPSYLENEIVHFHNFLGKKGTFHLKFKMEKKINPPEMWDRQILWKSTFVCFLVQDILLLFGDLLVIFLNLFCWILFGRHFLSFSLKLQTRKGYKLRLQKVSSWNSPIFRCELPVSRKVKQRWFLCSVLVIEAHWDTTGGIFLRPRHRATTNQDWFRFQFQHSEDWCTACSLE